MPELDFGLVIRPDNHAGVAEGPVRGTHHR
jgi:hypothetical protein